MKNTLLLLLFLGTSAMVNAQKDSCSRRLPFGAGVSAGIQHINLLSLNNANEKFAIPALNSYQRTYALNFYAGSEKLFILMWRENYAQKAAGEGSEVSLTGWNTSFQVGRRLTKGKLAFAPLIGFGDNILRLEYTKNAVNTNTTFSSIITSGAETASIVRSETYYLSAGFELFYLVHFFLLDPNWSGIGINAGYNFGLGKQNWKLKSGTTVTDVPAINNSGPFARIYYRI